MAGRRVGGRVNVGRALGRQGGANDRGGDGLEVGQAERGHAPFRARTSSETAARYRPAVRGVTAAVASIAETHCGRTPRCRAISTCLNPARFRMRRSDAPGTLWCDALDFTLASVIGE